MCLDYLDFVVGKFTNEHWFFDAYYGYVLNYQYFIRIHIAHMSVVATNDTMALWQFILKKINIKNFTMNQIHKVSDWLNGLLRKI